MFKMHCDRCGKLMKEVGGPEAKEISLSGKDILCKPCVAKENKLDQLADKLKRRWDAKMNEMVAEAKGEITAGLKEI